MAFNLADLFEHVADAVPRRIAVVEGERRVDYATLDDRTTRLAHGLARLGVAPGERVALCMRNRVEHVECLLAAWKLRAIPINVNWRYRTAELAHVFTDSGSVLVVHDAEFGTDVRDAAGASPSIRDVVVAGSDAYTALWRDASPIRDLGPRSGDDHYILYTGGTTGLPKGVIWRHEDIFFAAVGGGNPGGAPIESPDGIGAAVLANSAQRVGPFLSPGDPGPAQFVSLSLGPLMHASGQWGALGALLGGGTLVLDDADHLDLARTLDFVEREAVCMLTLVGDSTGRPLVQLLEHEPDRWDLSSLRLIGSGGSLLSAAVKRRLLEALPSVVAILEGLGSSESPAQATSVSTRGAPVPASLEFGARPETIVVDDDLRPIPRGSGLVGRLATRGRVPLGYVNDPVKSAATFVVIDGARYSLPGDFATIDGEGTVRLVGRGATCINTGGEKVFTDEVEAVLRDHVALADVAIVGRPDERFGARVAAVVALMDPSGVAPALDEVRAFVKQRLAGYKAPRELIVVDVIPRTPAGKIDHAALARALDTPAGRS